jgi:hypothetical protein
LEGEMRTPNIGDEYVSTRHSTTLGRTVMWRVTKISKKADTFDYVELEPVNERLQKKVLSVRALGDARLFSRVHSKAKAAA